MRNDRKKQEDYHETIFETWTGNFNGIHFMPAIWKDRCTGGNVVIALSASTVSVGNNVTATISVSGSDISAYTIYVSYNSSVLQYNSASGSAIVNGGGGTVTASGTSAGSFSIPLQP